MKYLLNDVHEEALEALFHDELYSRPDLQIKYRARNREARKKPLRNSMKGYRFAIDDY